MSRRPRGRAELRETELEAEAQPMLPKQEPAAAPVGEGEPLPQPGESPIEEPAAQAPLLELVIWLPEQQAHMLRPGWIALLQDVLPAAGQAYEARLLKMLDTRELEGARGPSGEQVLCLWQRLDTGEQFRQIVERW